MTNINELLDVLEEECGFNGPPYNFKEREAARAAVDAEIKRLQDRIAELEAAQEFFQYDEKAK